jgi:hypothetical protein
MRNEKGSVLSIAIVIIFVLSFAITTTSVYTANVAQRTSTIVQKNDEDLFARTIVRSAMHELKMFINSPLTEYTTFFNEDQEELERISTLYNELIVEYYLSAFNEVITEDRLVWIIIGDEEFTEDSTSFTRTYRLTYTRLNGRTISKELLVELKNDPDSEPVIINPISDFTDLFDFIATDDFDNATPLDCTGDCQTHFYETYFIEANRNRGVLDDRSVIKLEESLTIDPSNNPNQASYLDLRGSAMIINNDFTLNDVSEIRSSLVGVPGIIIVKGDFNITTHQIGLEINNVYIFVLGNVNITLTATNTNQGALTGSNYYFISTNPINNITPSSNNTFYEDSTIYEGVNYYYLGSFSQFPNFQTIQNNLQNIIDFDGTESFNQIFNYIEGTFEED